jgi:hypothetical protein
MLSFKWLFKVNRMSLASVKRKALETNLNKYPANDTILI